MDIIKIYKDTNIILKEKQYFIIAAYIKNSYVKRRSKR